MIVSSCSPPSWCMTPSGVSRPAQIEPLARPAQIKNNAAYVDWTLDVVGWMYTTQQELDGLVGAVRHLALLRRSLPDFPPTPVPPLRRVLGLVQPAAPGTAPQPCDTLPGLRLLSIHHDAASGRIKEDAAGQQVS